MVAPKTSMGAVLFPTAKIPRSKHDQIADLLRGKLETISYLIFGLSAFFKTHHPTK